MFVEIVKLNARNGQYKKMRFDSQKGQQLFAPTVLTVSFFVTEKAFCCVVCGSTCTDMLVCTKRPRFM